MSPLLIVLLVISGSLLYTIRALTNKLFAVSYDGDPSVATPVFSSITGFSGFLITVLLSGGIGLPNLTTLGCGVTAGCILFLYDLGNIRAAQTGPYSIQSIIGMFGCVLLPLLFERILWDVSLSALQAVGFISVLLSFVFLNLNNNDSMGVQKGFYGWVALLFFSNGIYSTILIAQQRWTDYAQRSEMIASVFLTLAIVSVLYLLLGCRHHVQSAFRLKKKEWGYALASSTALCLAMNLLVILLRYVNASVLYPIQNSAVLSLLVLWSALYLKEKLGKFAIVGIVLALIGIVALSV